MERPQTVICPHPELEQRGRIAEDGTESFRISLRDCLACSGCAITEDELELLSRQNPTLVLEQLRQHPEFDAIVSTEVLANVAAAKGVTLSEAFGGVKAYVESLGGHLYNEAAFRLAYRKLVAQHFMESSTRPLIISRCPGANLFVERKTKLAHLLAPVKPVPQLFALVRKTFVLSIAPCFDRKLESGRFDGLVDATLTASEIEQFVQPGEKTPMEFVGNDDVEGVLQMLRPGESLVSQKKGNVTQYSAGDVIGAKITGEVAIRNFVRSVETGKCEYAIVELDLCPGGCVSGGGLIRGKTPAARRGLVRSTENLLAEAASTALNEGELEEILQVLKGEDISARYASVEKEENPLDF